MDLRPTLPKQTQSPLSLGANQGVGQKRLSQPATLPPSTQTSTTAKTPKFGAGGFIGSFFTPTALEQFMVDNVGVYAPKMLTVRSKAQAFEETYLELIEDFAFYFAISGFGFGLANLFKKLYSKSNQNTPIDKIGTSFKGVTKNVPKELLGTKAGVLLGAISLAAGFEYLIQHTKNWATYKLFKINNFTAVAGLEKARLERKEGEDDSIKKARHRIKQVGGLTAGLLGFSFALPALVKHSPTVETQVRKAMQYVDFGAGKKAFDLSRFPLALIIASGVASYVDAARDKLERIETATRLAVVVPYLLFGKHIVGNVAASLIEKHKKVGTGNNRKTIEEHLKPLGLSYRTGAKPWQQFKTPGSFFELSTLQSDTEGFKKKIAASALSKDVQKDVVKWYNLLTNDMQQGTTILKTLGKQMKSLPLWVSAIIAGVGINVIAYKQTQNRFHRLHPHAQQPTSPFALAKLFHKPSAAQAENRHYWQADV